VSDLLGRLDGPRALVSPPVLDGSPATGAAAAALSDADAAAAAAGVLVREAKGRDELAEVCDLLAGIWRERPEDRAQTPVMLRAFSYSGNYVGIAVHERVMLAACVGFFGLADVWELHSHIAGVAAHARGRSVGYALKLHQRAWALSRGVDAVSWTFDPLIRRNAYFNLCKLGACARDYVQDFYGAMSDGINDGDHSDRIVVQWQLQAPEVAAACVGSVRECDTTSLRSAGAAVALDADPQGRPRRGYRGGRFVFVNPPDDIERLRVTDPAAARAWRYEFRHTLGELQDQGARVIGYSRTDGYVLDRSPS
jgi:predicted GNAT superfamily acetyltransferase